MNLKPLALAVIVLAALAGAAFLLDRPAAPTATADPRVGQPLLDPALAATATRLTLTHEGNTVTLFRPADTAPWQVATYHDLPADFPKLARFVRELTEATIDRFVTATPARLARLQFSDTTVTLGTPADPAAWSITLGRTADTGGRYVKFAIEDRAYLASLNTWLDATPKSWADTALVGLTAADIARLELTFPEDDSPLVLTRPDATAPFTTDALPDGQQLKSSTLTSLLNTLTGLRFTDTAPYDAPDAIAARAHARTVKLTTFSGAETSLALGRRPEHTIVKVPTSVGPAALGSITETAAEPAPETLQPETETIPAGPVYTQVTTTHPDAGLTPLATTLAFQISDFPYTSLPPTRVALFEPIPNPNPTPAPTP